MCFDGVNLAVDSRATQGGLVVGDKMQKLFSFNHATMGPMVAAFTGACDFMGPWLGVLQNEGFAPVTVVGMDAEYSMQGLFVDQNGDCWQGSTNGGYFFIGKEKAALGSSTGLAMYLLNKNKSALSAVKEVISVNLFCGGDIVVYNSKTGKITTYEKE